MHGLPQLACATDRRIERLKMSVVKLRTLTGLVLCVSLLAFSCNTTNTETETESTTDTGPASQPEPDASTQDPQGSLAGQQRNFLIQDALRKSKRLVQENRIADAEGTLLKALDLDKDHPDLRKQLAEVQRLLGKRTGEIDSWAAHMEQLQQIRIERDKAKAKKLIDDAKALMAGGDYDKAIRNLRQVELMIEIGGKRLDWKSIPETTASLLQRADLERAQADKAKTESAQREAFEAAQREEEILARRRKERTDSLLSKGTRAYETRDFRQARDLAREALKVAPNHEIARQLAAAAQKGFFNQVDDNYLVDKAKEFRRFIEANEERKVPYSDILTAPDPAYWNRITTLRARASASEMIAATKDADTIAIERAVETTRLPKEIKFDETSGAYQEVVARLNDWVRGVPILISPEAKEIIDGSSLVLVLDIGAPITLKNFLNIMCSRSEDQLAWIVQDGAVIMTTKAKSLGTPTPRIHEIADLTFPITNFAGPQIKTLPIGGEEDEEEPRAGGEVGDKVRFVEPEALQTLVQESVARGLWGADGVSIEVTGGNMLVVHTPEVQAKVEQFLNDLRKFQTSLVTVESKFLRVDRNWLQEFGVDFRGLGGANAKGTVAQLDDITNGLNNNASRGLDNGGVQDPNAHPNSGFFYDDGLDGDFRGRTENFFQNALGNLLTTTGGATFGFTILDDMQLNVLLRAVEKKLSLEVVDAQTLTVLNGQRANISVINQTSYIKDFAVEVATASFIADPEVDVIQDGVVLDVRPTISYDRKYITLDLQPTVAELVRPIPTFTTSLSGSTLPVTIQFPQMTVRSAATTVKVPDGGSVLIGGLNEVLNRERRAEVPWIANLPLISFLFKQEGVVDENSSLMVLVRGHIINVKEFMDVRTTAGGGTR
ncbi:MAG: hypothetical protein CMJ85_13025 [Planctomycetes bacterium]|nr:hypothetical protein [Planctomycetota bacterium]